MKKENERKSIKKKEIIKKLERNPTNHGLLWDSKILTKMKEDLKIDWPSFTRFYNATLQLHKSAIPRLLVITKGKRVQLQRLVNELGSKQPLVDAVVNMARSDFLNGRSKTPKFPKGFIASFPWLMANDERIADVANGKYDNPPEAELTAEELRQLELERYKAREAERRAEVRRIDEDESARKAKERDLRKEMAAKPDEIKRIIGDSWMLD